LYVDTTATINWITTGTGPWTVYPLDGTNNPLLSTQGIASVSCAY
jgi:hypothetical protein